MPKPKPAAPGVPAVIYARYSSHAQKDESIEQQLAECEVYAKANNLAIVDTFADRHLTGKTDKRPEFQRMMRAAAQRKFQAVIAYKSNRIARNMLHALDYENRLEKFGIRIIYVKEEFGDNAAGRFALRTMMNVNQFYSENMAEDIKRGMLDNARNCLMTNGSLPFGYKKGADGRYALDELNAPVVREIFERAINGEPFIDIARNLNARGIRTSSGKEWGKSSFHTLLSNERYTGVYIYSDVRVEGGVPQIITKEMYLTMQDKLHTKKNPQGRHRENGDYLLTGKLYCGKCKSHMVGMSGTSKSGNLHYYYICQKKRTERDCDKRTVTRDWLEREVTAAIKEYLLRDNVIEWMADGVLEYSKKYREKTDIDILEVRLKEVKSAIKNTMTAIEHGVFTDTTKERLLELESEQSTLNNQLLLERSAITEFKREDIISSLETFRDGDIDNKQYQADLFKTFLSAVYLYDDDMEIVFDFSGKRNKIRHPLNSEPEPEADNTESAEVSACSHKLSFGSPNNAKFERAKVRMA